MIHESWQWVVWAIMIFVVVVVIIIAAEAVSRQNARRDQRRFNDYQRRVQANRQRIYDRKSR